MNGRKPLSYSDMQQNGISLMKQGLSFRDEALQSIKAYKANRTNINDKNLGCSMLQKSIDCYLKGLINFYEADFKNSNLVKSNAQDLLDEITPKHLELREIDAVLRMLTGSIASLIFRWKAVDKYLEIPAKDTDIEAVNNISDVLSGFIMRQGYLN